ncbi:HNH endonuclease [Streptomyces sparsogenes]|uniref:HNH endonuclease n=1 Tax=Streptomyces sparsogenes TaxID=67365 RepID=UPI0033D954D6
MDIDDYVALDGRRISIGSHGYAQVWQRPHMLLLHRWVMGVPVGVRYRVIVDHIDRNILDCRRSNLRLVTPTASNRNRVIAPRDLPLGVYRTPRGRFQAALTRGYQNHPLGTFDTPEEAASAVAKARALFDSEEEIA